MESLTTKENYTLSIRLMAFNHGKYIKKAMDGIMMQQTNFNFEVVVGDDFSTDDTLQIINDYKSTSRILIRVLKRIKGDDYWTKRQEKGRLYNFTTILANCTGKYVSFLDGDDYWTDSNKLQNQVDFLEENPDYNLITGAVKRYVQDTDTFVDPNQKESYTFTYKDMIFRNHCSTCTTTIRNNHAKDFELFHDRGTDSQLWIRTLGKEGKGKYDNRVVAVYRKHNSGFSTVTQKGNDTFEKKYAAFQRKIDKANFWNDYFLKNTDYEVIRVKNKIRKKMYQLALSNKKYTKIPELYFQFVYTKLKLMLSNSKE